jgi:hypothetical protein
MESAWEVHSRLPRPGIRPVRSRKLRPHESALVMRAQSQWAEAKITTFMDSPDITGVAWDVGVHTVLFFAHSSIAAKEGRRIAELCGKLWDWLGVLDRPFTLVFWWRDDPRRIAVDEWPSKSSVNGGWTQQNSSVIYIYRSEEWERVFLHEMIHALGWDWKMPAKPLECWGLPHNSYIVPALFEAWTELYAEWLWCVWHQVPWEQQRAWQEHQARQILVRYVQLGMRSWQEDTSVFAYYILKAALAPHIAELLLFGNGTTKEEREQVLCRLVRPGLAALQQNLPRATPMSLRMTISTSVGL